MYVVEPGKGPALSQKFGIRTDPHLLQANHIILAALLLKERAQLEHALIALL